MLKTTKKLRNFAREKKFEIFQIFRIDDDVMIPPKLFFSNLNRKFCIETSQTEKRHTPSV